MRHLLLKFLGSYQVRRDGQPVTQFRSQKVRALLAYLAVEADRPHRRDVLAGLLWPDRPNQNARKNLSATLHRLRQAIGDLEEESEFLQITRESLQFNMAACWLDVTEFTKIIDEKDKHPHPSLEICGRCLGQLEKAAELYRGDFLQGFGLDDSLAFSEWALIKQESLHRRALQALFQTSAFHLRHGQYERALGFTQRQLEMEPWREEAHQQLIQILARSGDRSAALVQYEICRQVLAEELSVEPTAETTALYRDIRDGKRFGEEKRKEIKAAPAAPALPPPFLISEPSSASKAAPFVARKRELAQLGGFLKLAVAGRGRMVFVTGDAGSGKTTLVREFTQRAQETQADLVVAEASCNAYTGIGDPYLPFREILELLTGDVESRWAAGTISRESALRLWSLIPITIQMLIETGPELVDTFVAGRDLVDRALGYSSDSAIWLSRLEELVANRTTISSGQGLEQTRIFEAYTAVLEKLTTQRPLMLILDDLHWADVSSLALLFHLGKRITDSRILIIGTYRPEEITQGMKEEQHPIKDLMSEFKRLFGDIRVDLHQESGMEARGFVDALLDSEPNQLGERFRRKLARRTQGHALFTVELLRDMRERGELRRDKMERWVAAPNLRWDSLPGRVEGVIEKRIGRLHPALQEVLKVASVEGEEFTAELVAQVQGIDEVELVRRLSSELDKGHHLVRAWGIKWIGSQRISRYRFQHNLFQKYLYNSLDEVERSYLHEAVGNELETLYGTQVKEVSGKLARHFQEAGIPDKAIVYLLQAGNRAIRLSAYEEAIAHLKQGLDLIKTLPESPERARQELALQIALGIALVPIKGYAAPEVGTIFSRALKLGKQVGDPAQQFGVLWGLWQYHTSMANWQKGRQLAEQLLSQAERAQDAVLLPLAHRALEVTLSWLGELALAREHAERGLALYDPRHHRDYILLSGEDPGVHCRSSASWILWLLGYPDQALHWSEESLALAKNLSHPYSLAYALLMIGVVHLNRREGQAVQERAEAAVTLTTQHGFAVGLAQARFWRGWSLAEQGQVEVGIEQMRQSLAAQRAARSAYSLNYCLPLLAEVYGKAGQPEKGLTLLAEAEEAADKSGERVWYAEMRRLTGDLLLLQDQDEVEAERHFHEAIKVAQGQSAKSLELRAVMSLSRLLQKQGKKEKARRMLNEIFNWFTEGFETPDLIEAKALLETLV